MRAFYGHWPLGIDGFDAKQECNKLTNASVHVRELGSAVAGVWRGHAAAATTDAGRALHLVDAVGHGGDIGCHVGLKVHRPDTESCAAKFSSPTWADSSIARLASSMPHTLVVVQYRIDTVAQSPPR